MLTGPPFPFLFGFIVDKPLLVCAGLGACHTLRLRGIEHGHDIQIVAGAHIIGGEHQGTIIAAVRGGGIFGVQPCPRILAVNAVGECDFARHRTDGNLVFLAERLPLEGDDVVIGGAHAMQRHGYIEFETVLGYGLWNIPTDFKCFVSLTVIT